MPWSNRTSTGGNVGAQPLGHELQNSLDLFARHVELFDNLVDAEVFEVLDDGRDSSDGSKAPDLPQPTGHLAVSPIVDSVAGH